MELVVNMELVARVGVEPTRSYDLRILSPVCLPIPSPSQE